MIMKNLPRLKASNGLAYHRTGEGSPVVLVHGVGLRAESFGLQVESLKKSHTVFAIDMPGHGQSRMLEIKDPVLGDFTTALEEFVDEVIGEPILLAGHSMGAMIALDFAWRNSGQCIGVAALNAIHCRSPETTFAVKQRAKSLMNNDGGDVASAPIKRWFGESPRGHELEMAKCCSTWLSQVDRHGYVAAYTVFANNSGLTDAAISQINRPMLFLTGEDDKNSTPEMSNAMASIAPKGEAVIISNARHLAQLTHAKQVNSALSRFFARCDSEVSNPATTDAGIN